MNRRSFDVLLKAVRIIYAPSLFLELRRNRREGGPSKARASNANLIEPNHREAVRDMRDFNEKQQPQSCTLVRMSSLFSIPIVSWYLVVYDI